MVDDLKTQATKKDSPYKSFLKDFMAERIKDEIRTKRG